VKANQKEEKSE